MSSCSSTPSSRAADLKEASATCRTSGRCTCARVEPVRAALDRGNVEDVVDDGQQVGGCTANEVGVLDDLGVLADAASRCSPSSLAKPIAVSSGVRSSWLILARNSDFTLPASCVSMRAVFCAESWARPLSPASWGGSLAGGRRDPGDEQALLRRSGLPAAFLRRDREAFANHGSGSGPDNNLRLIAQPKWLGRG